MTTIKPKTRIEDLLEFDYRTVSGDIEIGANDKDKLTQLSLFRGDRAFLIGVDEVGRGCLAGPVVAAAALLPLFDQSHGLERSLVELDDSKKLNAAKRERLATLIDSLALTSIAEASPEEIDQINILNASLLAMKRAVLKLCREMSLDLSQALLIIDGNKSIKLKKARQLTVIKGDSRSASIAAASVVAKVYRDRLMTALSQKYPQYRWHFNKGYPSKEHRRAIKEHGMTVWHRQSFRCLRGDE